MGTVFLIYLLFFSCRLFALLDSCSASMEADRLLHFMQSKGPLIAHDDSSVTFESLSRVYVAPQVRLKDADRITSLPGQPTNGVDFAHYAGYVTVEPNNGRALFYYFVQSPIDPNKKPLLLWLNGGPGCSSIGYGAMQELGPFRVNSNGNLYLNKYSWNNVANIIFLDSPAGVGFSYSNTSSDNHLYGDKVTAMDSLTFLVNWLERFPEYKNRDFYITGESYAGHFGPQLAKLILLHNNNTDKPINLKGIAIGNAYVDTHMNSIERYEFLWSHAMYSDETHTRILKNCNMSTINSADCFTAQFQADTEVGRIDLYNIYSSSCRITSDADNSSTSNLEYDPCASGYVYNYLNNASVQNALHAERTNWNFCSSLDWSDSEDTMLYTIKQLISSGLRVWLYSGDVDSIVPVTATKSFIRSLKLPIEIPWRPWYNIGDSEVSGYAVAYKGLTFVTVRGAGHEVPSYQPERALNMITSFLQGDKSP